MKLVFGHLCDYAAIGQAAKLILVGIFDTLYVPASTRDPVDFPLSYLVLSLECSIAEGSEHDIAIELRDFDEDLIRDPWTIKPAIFGLSGPGRPLGVKVVFPVLDAKLPGIGDYKFTVLVDGAPIADVPIYVAPIAGQ